MKYLLVLLSVSVLCSGSPVLEEGLPPRDNSHYVEGESRYVWMYDGKDDQVLVDLQEPVDERFLQERNGADNQYRLFTRRNPTNPQIIVHGNANTVWNSNYISSRPLMVVVHGWRQNGNSPMNIQIRDAFLAVQDGNVIVVDWNRLANVGYVTAANGVPGVGQSLGNFLQWLFNTAGGNWNNVHLVGFSLGAHAVGNAGRVLQGRAARVTGLDPASYGWRNNANRIQRNAGQYVEGIHTDGHNYGIFDPVGHADFYPNGGQHFQPGCTLPSCSHGRAPEFFAASVRHNHLVGRLCISVHQANLQTCTGAAFNMGNSIITKRGTGIYGLRTGSVWPF